MKSKELISKGIEWRKLKSFFMPLLEVLMDRPPLSKTEDKAQKLAIWLAQYMAIFAIWVMAEDVSYKSFFVSVLIAAISFYHGLNFLKGEE